MSTQSPITYLQSRRRTAEEHFAGQAEQWKTRYSDTTLEGRIYQRRHAVTLSWIDELNLPLDSRVLDLGCGAGVMSVELGTRGFCVDALDSVPEMRMLTAQAVQDSKLEDRVRVLPGNAYKLEIRNETYDLVVALGVLPWVRVPGRVISEIKRVLRPGGYLLVSADNYWRLNHLLDPRLSPVFSLFRKATLEALKRVRGDAATTRSILRLDRCKTVDTMLQQTDLHVLRRLTLGFGPFSFWRRQICSEKLGIRIDSRLQTAADRGHPLLRTSGSHYLVLAQREK